MITWKQYAIVDHDEQLLYAVGTLKSIYDHPLITRRFKEDAPVVKVVRVDVILKDTKN